MKLEYMPVAIPLPAGTLVTIKVAIDVTEQKPAFAMVKYFPVLDLQEIQAAEAEQAMEECESIEAYLCNDAELPLAFYASEVVHVYIPSAAQQTLAPDAVPASDTAQ